MLTAQGNIAQDQTRQGKSSSGKSAGEVDIKITYSDYEPALIEALKTNSLDSRNIEDHIMRLMVNYDPIGVYSHFLLIYFLGKSFSEYASKLAMWLKTCSISQISFYEITAQRLFTNLMEIRAACKRDNQQEELIIFVMNINK